MREYLSSFVSATLIFCFVPLTSAIAHDLSTNAYGFWINRSGWVIETRSCDDGLCGTVIGIGGRTDDAQRIDIYNPDPDLRQRPLCSIQIFGAFQPSGTAGEWDNGWLYNPLDGKTYSSNMKLGESDTLEVRGFILNPIFGRTIVLNRVEAPSENCDPHEKNAQGRPPTG